MKKLFLISIISAAFLSLGWNILINSSVKADPNDPTQSSSVGIEGVIKANPPTTAATIAFPANGQTFSSLPIKVGGSCPTGLLIKIFKNGVFGGSVQCTNGSYSITIDLFDGQNELIARDYDALDQVGPDSNKVTVTYNQGGFNTSAARVSLTSIYAKRGANPKETLIWPITLSGGTGPYAVSVDWGDNKNDLISLTQPGNFDISHSYNSPGVYIILIKVTDQSGNSSYLQLVGVGNGALSQTNQSTDGNTTVIVKNGLNFWFVITSAVLIIISFWLGGRYKLENLRREADKRIQY